MSYTVRIVPSAQKELERLPDDAFDRIVTVIRSLAAVPRPRGCKKLTGSSNYRLRVGRYRIVYAINDDESIVTVAKVGHRGSVYD